MRKGADAPFFAIRQPFFPQQCSMYGCCSDGRLAVILQLPVNVLEFVYPFLQLALEYRLVRQVERILCSVDVCILRKRELNHSIIFVKTAVISMT